MDYVLIVRITLGALYGVFTIMRILFAIIAMELNQDSDVKDSIFSLSIIQIYIISIIIITFTFVTSPDWYAWGNIPNYPNEFVWVGMTIGVLSLGVFFIAHFYLGKYYSFFLKIQKDHKFVSNGPYKLIRHPMYTAYILFHTAIFLITGNWFIGIIWIGGICLILLLRIRKEEELLVETFGDEYVSYKQRTGSLFPPIFKFLNRKTRKLDKNTIDEEE